MHADGLHACSMCMTAWMRYHFSGGCLWVQGQAMVHSPAGGPGGHPAAGGARRGGPTPGASPALGPLAAVEQLQRSLPPRPLSSPGSARPGQPLVRPKSVLQETMREVRAPRFRTCKCLNTVSCRCLIRLVFLPPST